ncbi:MAG TPA: ferredoxin [Candidatus Micrarchaeota archaeon]|nr:ferredoxin [Candidatus Micrarchaeota archaeon]
MPKLILVHERGKCIGCGACAAIAPGRWRMGKDGLADLIGGADAGNECYSRQIPEGEFESGRQAATTCPVNVIHLEKDGKRGI